MGLTIDASYNPSTARAHGNGTPSPQASSAAAAEFADRLERTQSATPNGPARGTLVRSQRTPLTLSQAAGAIRHAWQTVMGASPNEQTVSILTAQWAHETAQGTSMYNYNFGGIKGVGPSGLTVAARTREGWGATERTLVDNFRAYQSPEEGAADYVRLLASRYGDALKYAKSGDPAGFVRAIKARGYFTGDEQAYISSVSRLSQLAASAVGTQGNSLPQAGPASSSRSAALGDALTRANFLPVDVTSWQTITQLSSVSSETGSADARLMAEQLARAALRLDDTDSASG